MKISKVRRNLYKTARLLGDLQSLTSPRRAARRILRKRLYRSLGRLVGKIV